MKNNYEFTFDSNLQTTKNEDGINILTNFISDIFPYFSMQSVTCGLLITQILWFLLSFNKLTFLPIDFNQSELKNVFLELLSNLIYGVLIGRLGSQYESKLGCKYYLSLVIVIQLLRFLLIFLLNFNQNNIIIVNNSSLLSLFILSLINIQKWKQNELVQYKSQQKVVQNYDLLDLNDTIIKLKQNQNLFMYQSYTNKEFYIHNLKSKDEKIQKIHNKSGKKSKKKNKFMEQINNQQENYQIRLFKLIIFHFIAYSCFSSKEFIILFVTQATIYLLIFSKLLKKLIFV